MGENVLFQLVHSVRVEIYHDVEGDDILDALVAHVRRFERHVKNASHEILAFKRYAGIEYIDDPFLCENYLGFSAVFGEARAPAIVVRITFTNGEVEAMTLDNGIIERKFDDLADHLIFLITLVMSSFLTDRE